VLFYPAALPLSTSTLNRVAGLIRTHRKTIGSHWRVLDLGTQALLTLAYLRKGDAPRDLASGFGISAATAWRRTRETILLLAARQLRCNPAWTTSRSGVVSVVRQENTRAAAEARTLQEAFGAGTEAVFDSMADLFAGGPARMSARDYVRGLLAPLERKNCATIAEWAGHSSPDRLHYLLERAVWDERVLQVRLAALAVEHLGGKGVSIYDETGDLMKGRHSLGVARQYTGTAGRVENAQVTTRAVWSTPRGHALVDYEAYLHKEWCAEDDARLGASGAMGPVPKRIKGQQAAVMTRRFLVGPARPSAVVATGDKIYGASPHLRADLYAHQVPFVLAVVANTRLRPGPGLEAERASLRSASRRATGSPTRLVRAPKANANTPGTGCPPPLTSTAPVTTISWSVAA
jgi:hypothetical protein